MKKLHKNQEKLLEIFREGVAGLTIREMQEKLKAKSPSVVQHHIAQLEKKGLIRRNPNNPQDYQVVMNGSAGSVSAVQTSFLPVYACDYCGGANAVEDCQIVDQVEVSTKIFGLEPAEVFLVRAKGDSMRPKIGDKDLVVVRKSEYADSGDIITCINNQTVLIKKYFRNTDQGILLSLDTKEEPVLVSSDFKILGVVKGVISRFS